MLRITIGHILTEIQPKNGGDMSPENHPDLSYLYNDEKNSVFYLCSFTLIFTRWANI